MYKQANILKLDQFCTFQTIEFMFKNQCKLLPNTFFDYFTTVSGEKTIEGLIRIIIVINNYKSN